jgi:predicted AAA+ superfamily ATPase
VVLEEIKIEAQVRQIGGFLRFLPLVAAENGEIVNFSNIARESSISLQTVRTYFQILEDTLLGFFLLPFGRSVRKQAAGHPKFYLFDPGVVTAIRRTLSVPMEPSTPEFGDAFEHYLITEMVRLNEYFRLDLRLSFYRSERGVEVDCIIETPRNQIIAVEVKATDTPASFHAKGLRSFKAVVPEARSILVCRTPTRRESAASPPCRGRNLSGGLRNCGLIELTPTIG